MRCKPLPTMIEDLRAVSALLRKHGRAKDAAWFGRLIAVAESEPGEFWRQFNCNEIWGGAGSIVDQFLIPGTAEHIDRKNDRKQFYESMARLAHEMAAAGIVNSRAQSAAQAFEYWATNSL